MTAKPATRVGIWPPLRARSFWRSREEVLPFPLSIPSCRIYSRARQGLWNGVRALGLRPGDEVLAPAYHQGAEIEAFVRAGLQCRFYRIDESLSPLSSDLEDLLTDRTRALHVIHYWGMPQDVSRLRDWCDRRGLFLIEDCAQAFLAKSNGEWVGQTADLAVYCLYKSFGLPDGAAAYCRADLPLPDRQTSIGAWPLARRLGSSLTSRSVLMARLRDRFVPEHEDVRPEGGFLQDEYELGDPDRSSTLLSTYLLPRVIDPAAASRRRTNYEYLLDRLSGLIPKPFEQLADGAVPIAFPVASDSPTDLAAAIRAKGIVAGVLWPTRHACVPAGDWSRADFFRHRVLALPVHQELSGNELKRIADAVLGAVGDREIPA